MYQNDYRRINDMMRQKGVFTHLETGYENESGYDPTKISAEKNDRILLTK